MDTAKSLIQNMRFLGMFFLVFFLSSVFLFAIDFVPERPEVNVAAVAESQQMEEPEQDEPTEHFPVEKPVRIAIETIGVDTPVVNPVSIDIQALDDALHSGAVRYPGSAQLGENATMFLFGHQSGLPVVRNQAFKAFNNLQELEDGDVIRVYSETAIYEYTVDSVSLVRAESALIPLTEGERTLVLSTCNSFGDPGERYVVTATFSNRISNS